MLAACFATKWEGRPGKARAGDGCRRPRGLQSGRRSWSQGGCRGFSQPAVVEPGWPAEGSRLSARILTRSSTFWSREIGSPGGALIV